MHRRAQRPAGAALRTCRADYSLGRRTVTYLSKRDVPAACRRLETSGLSHPTPRHDATHQQLVTTHPSIACAPFDLGRYAQARSVTSRPGQPPTPTPQQVPLALAHSSSPDSLALRSIATACPTTHKHFFLAKSSLDRRLSKGMCLTELRDWWTNFMFFETKLFIA